MCTKHTLLYITHYVCMCIYATLFNSIPNFFQLVISFQVTQNDITIDIIKPESFPFCTSIICSLYLCIGSPLFECRHIAVYVCIYFKIYIPTPTPTHAKAPTFFFQLPYPTCFLPDVAEIKTRHLSTGF